VFVSSEAVSHGWHLAAVLMLTRGRHTDTTDRGLELDQRMGLVVRVGWARLARSAEVGVMADSALITITSDIGSRARAQRTIAAHSVMDSLVSGTEPEVAGTLNRLVQGNEPVAGVDERGVHLTARAVIPIGTIQALVADALDGLVTTITDRGVDLVTTRCQATHNIGL